MISIQLIDRYLEDHPFDMPDKNQNFIKEWEVQSILRASQYPEHDRIMIKSNSGRIHVIYIESYNEWYIDYKSRIRNNVIDSIINI